MSTHVLIAGAGPAAIETALALRHHAAGHVTATFLAPETEFVYRPVSVAEPFAMGAARRYSIRSIAEDTGATHLAGTLEAVDPGAHRVRLQSGSDLAYDVLVVTIGARPESVVAGATTFWGPDDAEALHGLVQDVELGYVQSVAFVVPPGTAWPLPLYELALMTAERAYGMYSAPTVHLVTPEAAPLEVFGPDASASVRELLGRAGIDLHTGQEASVEGAEVILHPSGARLAAARTVALPGLFGRPIPGLPADAEGFLPVDAFGAVRGVADVYAAGDITDFPLKQGGLATQQADSVASAIAARAGGDGEPVPFEPVLRGMLLTEHGSRWMRGATAAGDPGAVADHALWWPPTKIAGRFLAPYLFGLDEHAGDRSPRAGLPIEVRLAGRAPSD